MNYLPNPLTPELASRLRCLLEAANQYPEPIGQATLLMRIVVDCVRMGISIDFMRSGT
ncbi:hypothetical protein [Burkholderia gladioli]|uniref:hypothetical protein n=1 Tax=Burkholderia gladioli TaxID=28095 RepID=UPI001640112C|nr:hypothetical protein [Burkholderia gladioli]